MQAGGTATGVPRSGRQGRETTQSRRVLSLSPGDEESDGEENPANKNADFGPIQAVDDVGRARRSIRCTCILSVCYRQCVRACEAPDDEQTTAT